MAKKNRLRTISEAMESRRGVKEAKVNDAQKAEILKDFLEWSGGVPPNEVHWERNDEDKDDEPGILDYIDSNIDLPEDQMEEIVDWFKQLNDTP